MSAQTGYMLVGIGLLVAGCGALLWLVWSWTAPAARHAAPPAPEPEPTHHWRFAERGNAFTPLTLVIPPERGGGRIIVGEVIPVPHVEIDDDPTFSFAAAVAAVEALPSTPAMLTHAEVRKAEAETEDAFWADFHAAMTSAIITFRAAVEPAQIIGRRWHADAVHCDVCTSTLAIHQHEYRTLRSLPDTGSYSLVPAPRHALAQ